MILYVVIEQEELNRLEKIEQKYFELKKNFERLSKSAGNSEKEKSVSEFQGSGEIPKTLNASGNGENSEVDINKDGNPVLENLPENPPPMGPTVTKSESTNDITVEQILPFVGSRLQFRTKKLLENLAETNVTIDSSGKVSIGADPIPNANGILLLKSVLMPSKKKPVGYEKFKEALVTQGLGSFFKKRSVSNSEGEGNVKPRKFKKKIPNDWWYVGV